MRCIRGSKEDGSLVHASPCSFISPRVCRSFHACGRVLQTLSNGVSSASASSPPLTSYAPACSSYASTRSRLSSSSPLLSSPFPSYPPILVSSYPPPRFLCAPASPRLLALFDAYVRPKLPSHRSDFSASNAGMLSALSSVVLARPPATDPHAPRAIPPPLRRPPPRTIADLEEKRFWREIFFENLRNHVSAT